jgi:hypothetical protein
VNHKKSGVFVSAAKTFIAMFRLNNCSLLCILNENVTPSALGWMSTRRERAEGALFELELTLNAAPMFTQRTFD